MESWALNLFRVFWPSSLLAWPSFDLSFISFLCFCFTPVWLNNQGWLEFLLFLFWLFIVVSLVLYTCLAVLWAPNLHIHSTFNQVIWFPLLFFSIYRRIYTKAHLMFCVLISFTILNISFNLLFCSIITLVFYTTDKVPLIFLLEIFINTLNASLKLVFNWWCLIYPIPLNWLNNLLNILLFLPTTNTVNNLIAVHLCFFRICLEYKKSLF